jgi:hypothetical protein
MYATMGRFEVRTKFQPDNLKVREDYADAGVETKEHLVLRFVEKLGMGMWSEGRINIVLVNIILNFRFYKIFRDPNINPYPANVEKSVSS